MRGIGLSTWLAACALACGSPAQTPHVTPEATAVTAETAPPTEIARAPDRAVAAGATPAAVDLAAPASEPPAPIEAPATIGDPEALRAAIRAVRAMPGQSALRRAARAHHMTVVNLTWEDTGRYLGSSAGPNISDLTLEVIDRSGRRPRTSLLPVLRYPNFTDRTADVPVERMFVRVGNEAADRPLQAVALMEVLSHLRDYLSAPGTLRSESDDFTAARDSHFLVSAQFVFVPVPDASRVEFAPVLFNYQSEPGTPADLVLIATRQGLSIQVIENRPDALIPGGWGQHLYFNHAGQRTTFTAERRSDVQARIESGAATADDATALETGADLVMIVQVPLRLPYRPSRSAMASGGGGLGSDMDDVLASAGGISTSSAPASDVETAVIGHGLDAGPVREVGRTRIRRDPHFPIRVTIQFYRATSNGVVSEADLEEAAAQIERVYADADFAGSLVIGSQDRPTAWTHP
jgi:hypothetical protein